MKLGKGKIRHYKDIEREKYKEKYIEGEAAYNVKKQVRLMDSHPAALNAHPVNIRKRLPCCSKNIAAIKR